MLNYRESVKKNEIEREELFVLWDLCFFIYFNFYVK